MFYHHYPETAPFAQDYFHLSILLRRLYRFGAYDIEGVNCHVLAIVLSQCYEVYEAEHGGVWGHDRQVRHQHSWLKIGDSQWIIDVKPIHCVTLSPLLLWLGTDSIYGEIYDVHRSEALMTSIRDPRIASASEHLLYVLNRIEAEAPITESEVKALMKGYS